VLAPLQLETKLLLIFKKLIPIRTVLQFVKVQWPILSLLLTLTEQDVLTGLLVQLQWVLTLLENSLLLCGSLETML